MCVCVLVGVATLKRSMIGECKVFVRARPIKSSHSEVGDGLQQCIMKITHDDLL